MKFNTSNVLEMEFTNFVDLLRYRADIQPDKTAFIFLQDGETEAGRLTYRELDSRARAVARELETVTAAGERALLLYPSGLDFIAAFFGCLYAGVVAVPAYPPRRNQKMSRLEAIAIDAQATVVLTATFLLGHIKSQLAENPAFLGLHCIATDCLVATEDFSFPETAPDTLAFLQYTSGSTGTPKGVMVSHGNMWHNQRLIQTGFQHTEQSLGVGWLPLFHDMGLIGNMLQAMYLGCPYIFMPPTAFLMRPLRWLTAISRYKATTSGGPNFAYDLCANKITPEERLTLDLSSWQVAFNGAEPVRAETIERFARTFADCGFQRKAFYPCYGMAETTLIVSGGLVTAPPVLQTVQKAALEQNLAVPASQKDEATQTLVGCGKPLQDLQVVIAHPETMTRCQPDEIGEFWVSGGSVAQGYWNRNSETEHTFRAYLQDTGEGPFLRTGDLGFLQNGELFVTGRLKDLIIIRGRNHYPQDIEFTVENSHPALQNASGAVFSIDVAGAERLAVVIEVKRTHLQNLNIEEVMRAIRQAVAENHDLQVYGIQLLKPGSIPKTSSGKIQRHACRTGFLNSSLDLVTSSILQETDATYIENHLSREILLTVEATKRQPLLESYLQEQVARVLKIAPAGANPQQPLSSLGLDSLMAVELTNSIEANLGVALPMTSFLQGNSIAEISNQVLAGLTAPASNQKSSLTPASSAGAEHPLSYGQRAMWFLHQLAPESRAYNIVSAVRIKGELNIPALQRAFEFLVERHPALRTTFTAVGPEPAQRVNEHIDSWFQHEDASGWSEDSLKERLHQEAYRPFNLERGPLLRVNLFARSSQEHILLLAVHHIVADFWSIAVLVQELGMLYQAQKDGTSVELNPLALQYADYSRAVAQMLASPKGDRLWAYWQKQLAGELPVLNLPTARPRPPIQTYRGASIPFKLSAELTEKLNIFSRAHNTTLYMTLLAAFQVLLYRYTGQEDILVGSPTAGRSGAELAGLVGYFVNPVVLRASFLGNPTFEAFLGQVRQTVLDAFNHQDYPFALLVERLQPVREPSRSPLFQTMFVLQKASQLDEEGLTAFALGEAEALMHLAGLALESFALEQRWTQFDLTLTMAQVAGRLAASFEYSTDLFDDATITRMAGHFQTLLEGIVANPHQRLSELPLLTAAERDQLLVEWNDTKAFYPQDRCVHQLFEAQVERTPDAVAVAFEDRQLTYRQLNAKANQLAHYLQELGTGPEVLVGICVERSLEMVVGLLGILKAGGAYVPLDPAYPKERLAYMLADSQVPVLLTQENLLAEMPENKARVLCLDSDWNRLSQSSNKNLVSRVKPFNLAYVIYTSGSTGKPKGVMVEHGSVLNLLTGLEKAISFPRPDSGLRVSLNASLAFDASVQQLIHLLHGGTLDIVPQALRFDGSALLSYFRQRQIDVFDTTPSQLRLLISAGLLGDNTAPNCVLVGGEPIDESTWTTLTQAARTNFYNVYGPTECTVDATVAHLKMAGLKPTIGRPLANTQVYILDSQLQPIPISVQGELYIGGAGLARGYFNRPDLTQEKFISNPFNNEPGSRLYKTGDLARYLPDGNIEFLGRLDSQVKVRGFRIELSEIESVLAQHPDVRSAAVTVREDTPGDRRLVAYFVPKQEPAPTISDLRRFLLEQLPEYMVPSAFVILETLPLTPNGKVDRRSLKAPDTSSLSLETTFAAPRTPTEEILAALWGDILGVRAGIHDNFFTLGGHSLKATQVISRVRDAFGVDLPVRSLFESPTVAEFSLQIDAARHAESGLAVPPISPVPRSKEMPVSFAQERLWFLEQLNGLSATYNMPIALHLSGPLHLAGLEQSLTEIARRHEILRANFHNVNGSPALSIAPSEWVTVPVVDLQPLPEAAQSADVHRRATEEAMRPFDLATDRLWRVTLLQLAPQSHVMLLTIHHIVGDGWSWGIFLRELAAVYGAFCQGEPSPLPELPIGYADFAHWQRQWLTAEVLERQLSYWKQQLAGAPPLLELPYDLPRPRVQSFRGGRQSFELDAELAHKLVTLSQKSGATLFITLMAAFVTLLHRYSGQSDIVVGSPIANRQRSEIEPLIGFFVNTLALRTRVAGNPSFSELLAQVRQTSLDAYAHQDLPFERLVEQLQPQRSLSYTPVFQVMFVLQNAPLEKLELPGLTLTRLATDSETAKFDLTLSLQQTEAGLSGDWEYNSDLFEPATIRRMIGHFQTLLEAIVANPEQGVASLPLLTESERHQLLVEWNDTKAFYPQDRCVHQLFEAQVERTPDAVAVVFEDKQLTYRQLNAKANQLAHHLQKLGVKPEVLVGICVERSLEMVVGLLGILKAGGAYVPLDPAYPKERLAYMLADSQVPVLVTSSHLVDRLPNRQARAVCLDTVWETIGLESEGNPVSVVTAEHLAYVIYTSGSTGKPKGALNTHRGICNYLLWRQEAYPLTASDRVLQKNPFSFDVSVWELFWPLIVGARLVVAQPDGHRYPDYLVNIIAGHKITAVHFVPAMLQAFLQQQDLGSCNSLKRVFCGGEPLELDKPKHFFERFDCELHNLYGPTEAAINCTYWQCQPKSNLRTVPIGRPIANTQIYILDSHNQPVPIGVPGELHIGGVGLAFGYLNRPELTAEKFIPNPYSDEPGARLYKTGDRARYLPDGNIEFLGRLDSQVKVRGFRIELGEIESVLAQHPNVRSAAVTVREDTPGDKRLVAYFVAKQEPAPTISDLRRFLLEQLPEYMVPSAFVILETLPLTPNGKVDRRSLRAPDTSHISLEIGFVAPRSTLEMQLVQMWENVLNVQPVGVRDSFFDLGGHSLLAVRLMALLQQQFGKYLPLATLFQNPTIEHQASLLRQQTDSQPSSPLVAIQPAGSQPPFFCAHPVGGNVLCYFDLARHLGKDRPFYGLQSAGLNGEGEPLTRIEDMAAHYIEALQAIQPSGPYYLGGWSLGGAIAFEMAQQLRYRGEEVALLALIDSYAPAALNRLEEMDEAALLAYLARDMGGLFGKELPLSVDELRQLPPEEQLNYIHKRAKILNILPPEVSLEQMRQLMRVFQANREAMLSYIPQPYPGKVTLLSASEKPLQVKLDPTLGWGELATGGIDIHPIPGDHYAIVREPHVKLLAQQLATYLKARNQ